MYANENESQVTMTFVHSAGFSYLQFSLLPAIIGTTLPLWLRPQGFHFRWIPAAEFIFVVVLLHVGFSFLKNSFYNNRNHSEHRKGKLICSASCILTAIILCLHLNTSIEFHSHVPHLIFYIYFATTVFLGILYLVPPFNFIKRLGGETIVAFGFGMMPVLGAYLVQVGDLTRTVYVASLPVVILNALILLLNELINVENINKKGWKNIVTEFGTRISARIFVPGLIVLFFCCLIVSVLYTALNSVALIVIFLYGVFQRILLTSFNRYNESAVIKRIFSDARRAHFYLCIIIILSSVYTLLI